MTEQKRNGYDDDDMRQILGEIEDMQAQQRTIRSRAAGECSAIAKQIANRKKDAAALHIPKALLNALLKQRALERKLQDVADDIPDDLVELYEDASGQFSFIAPTEEDDDPEPEEEPPAKRAAKKRAKAAAENEAREQKEGADVLDQLSGGKPN